jgi:hypothetical protein
MFQFVNRFSTDQADGSFGAGVGSSGLSASSESSCGLPVGSLSFGSSLSGAAMGADWSAGGAMTDEPAGGTAGAVIVG